MIENIHRMLEKSWPISERWKKLLSAEIIFDVMFKKKFNYLTNTVIRLDGGKFARM